MITATMFEAKTRLSELVKQVQKGETVIITSGREKRPVAKLEAIEPKTRPKRLGVAYTSGFVLPGDFDEPLMGEGWDGEGE